MVRKLRKSRYSVAALAFVLVVALLLIAGSALAAPVIGTFTQSGDTSGDITFSHTVPAGDDRLLIVTVNHEGETVNDVTYDGTELTFIEDADEGSVEVEHWYLINPPVGTANVVVDMSPNDSNPVGTYAVNITGASQFDPIGVTGFNTANSCPGGGISVTLNGMASDSIVYGAGVVDTAGGNPFTPFANVTELWDTDNSADDGLSYWGGWSTPDGSGSRVFGFDPSNTQDCAIVAMEIRMAEEVEPNPDLAAGCGLNFVLILDESGSITGGEITAVRNAADAFLTALIGTGSQVAVVEFNSEARTVFGYTSLSQTNYDALLDPYLFATGGGEVYDPEDYNSPNFYTNWQDAFLATYDINAGGPIADLVVFITDGDPTAYNDPDTGDPVTNTDENLALSFALPVANDVRAQGSHMFGVGVGLTANSASETRLSLVTGPDEYPVPESDFAMADYTLTTDFSGLANALQEVAFALCGNSLTVTKYVDDEHEQVPLPDFPLSGTVSVTEGGQDADAYMWEQPVVGDAGTIGQEQGGVTGADGTFTWQWAPDDGNWTSEIVFSESSTDLTPDATINCLRSSPGEQGQTAFQVSLNGGEWEVAFGAGDIVTCDLINDGNFDWGDAPETAQVAGKDYPTLAANDGARHLTYADDPILGDLRDTEANGLPHVDAEGDDNDGVDDEDGVSIPGGTSWSDGEANMNVQVTNGPGCLNVWLDWTDAGGSPLTTGDGDFDDAGEHVVVNQTLPDGITAVAFPLPVNAANNATWYMRLRLTPMGTGACVTEADNYLYADGVASPTNQAFGGEIEDYVLIFDEDGTVPVTLSYFATTAKGDQVTFDWSTATAAGNVGFNLYADVDGRLVRLNEQIISSHRLDSLDRQDYTFAARTSAGAFYLEEVDIAGNTQQFGPFSLGAAVGDRTEMERIDWAAIRAEHEAKTAQRHAAILATAARGPESGYPVFDVLVEQDGLYRISHAELLAAGLDLSGVQAGTIAMTNQGRPVAIYVGQVPHFSPPSIGPVGGFFNEYSYIEFIGEAVDTLYTETNVYKLLVDGTQARRMPTANGRPSPTAVAATSYLETVLIEENKGYSFASPTDDPWYDKELRAFTTPVSWDFTINTPGYLAAEGPATLLVNMYGLTYWPANPDHHVVIELNGMVLADELFDGLTNHPVEVEIPAGVLVDGANTMTIRMPADTGVDWDIVNLESYGIRYPRAFMAQDGALDFAGNADRYDVDNLQTSNIAAYRIIGDSAVKLVGMQPQASSNGFLVPIRGSAEAASYLVADVAALLSPGLAPALPEEDITSGGAELLIISHPDFLAGLPPLVAAREAEGLTVKVVNVEQVYLQFSGSVFEPQAIKEYIAYAAANMGAQYVLLVGGDTYDYFNYQHPGAMSFIPTLYTQTDWIVKYAPVDPLFTDMDGDMVPDLPIGRFPVRMSSELTAVIDKTLSYGDKDYERTGVFAADLDFGSDSQLFVGELPADWTVQEANLDSMTVAEARAVLINSLNQGVALTSFVGHSGMDRWTYRGLFNANDAAALTNYNRPTVVTQWGCWNTYHVSPAYNTMAHKFMVSGTNGAAAVLGASTLTLSSSERVLGQLMMPYLTQPGMRMGDAIQTAKSEMAGNYPNNLDVLLGWTLLGDPTIIIQR